MDEFSESDSDDVEPKRNPAEILGALELQLIDLLYVGSGRPPSAELIYVRPKNENENEKEKENKEGVLCPRTKRTFYKVLLKGSKLWKRPPHEHCKRCADYTTTVEQIKELTYALCDTYNVKTAMIVENAGGTTKAHARKRELEAALPDLKKHVEWLETARAWLKDRQRNLREHDAMLQLD